MESWSQARIHRKHGIPEKPEDLASHEALMQGTAFWQFLDGEKDGLGPDPPEGRFKASHGTAPRSVRRRWPRSASPGFPSGLTDQHADIRARCSDHDAHRVLIHRATSLGFVVRPLLSRQSKARKVRACRPICWTEMLLRERPAARDQFQSRFVGRLPRFPC